MFLFLCFFPPFPFYSSSFCPRSLSVSFAFLFSFSSFSSLVSLVVHIDSDRVNSTGVSFPGRPFTHGCIFVPLGILVCRTREVSFTHILVSLFLSPILHLFSKMANVRPDEGTEANEFLFLPPPPLWAVVLVWPLLFSSAVIIMFESSPS